MIIDNWFKIRKFLIAAIEQCNGTHNEDDVLIGVYSGKFQLWVSDDANGVMITEIVSYPRKKVLNCFLGGGDLSSLRTLRTRIEGFAKETGCEDMAILGRPGWARVFPNSKQVGILLQEDLRI